MANLIDRNSDTNCWNRELHQKLSFLSFGLRIALVGPWKRGLEAVAFGLCADSWIWKIVHGKAALGTSFLFLVYIGDTRWRLTGHGTGG